MNSEVPQSKQVPHGWRPTPRAVPRFATAGHLCWITDRFPWRRGTSARVLLFDWLLRFGASLFIGFILNFRN